MITDDVAIWALTERVIGCGMEVHKTLGPGLLESVYREYLVAELDANQLSFESERYVPIEYKGRRIRGSLKLDLLVEDSVVVEGCRIAASDSSGPIDYLSQTDWMPGRVTHELQCDEPQSGTPEG